MPPRIDRVGHLDGRIGCDYGRRLTAVGDGPILFIVIFNFKDVNLI
jgi:hypothetical protein